MTEERSRHAAQSPRHKRSSLSKHLELKNVDLRLDEQQFEHKYIYRSCCLEMDKRVLNFVCKISIIMTVLIFSLYNLSTSSKHSEVYFSLVSSIVTLFITPPTLKHDDDGVADSPA